MIEFTLACLKALVAGAAMIGFVLLIDAWRARAKADA